MVINICVQKGCYISSFLFMLNKSYSKSFPSQEMVPWPWSCCNPTLWVTSPKKYQCQTKPLFHLLSLAPYFAEWTEANFFSALGKLVLSYLSQHIRPQIPQASSSHAQGTHIPISVLFPKYFCRKDRPLCSKGLPNHHFVFPDLEKFPELKSDSTEKGKLTDRDTQT